MVKSIEGRYRDGKVELLEPAPTASESRVIVTFIAGESRIDLSQRAIDAEQAASLRARLKPMEEDWRRPEMDVYDAL